MAISTAIQEGRPDITDCKSNPSREDTMSLFSFLFGGNNPDNETARYLKFLADIGFPVDNPKRQWWSKYPERAFTELTTMDEKTNARPFVIGRKLVWEEWITNTFGTEFLLSIETENYPHRMPKVFLKSPSIKPANSIHMFSDGSLCLQHAADYDSQTAIAEIRAYAVIWCFSIEVYANTGKWPAAQ